MYSFTLIALSSALCAAVANILARKVMRNHDTASLMGVNFFVIGFMMLALSPWYFSADFSRIVLGLIFIISIIDLFANYFLFKTFEKTDSGTATPLLSLSPIFTFIFSWFFLNESLPAETMLLVGLIIFGLFVFSVDLNNFGPFTRDTLTPAISSSLFYGASAVPISYLLSEMESINAPTLFLIRAFLIAVFCVLAFGLPIRSLRAKDFFLLSFRGIFVIAQYVLLYIAITLGNTGVAVTLGNITPVFVFLLSIVLLGESPTWRKAMAAGMVLVLSLLI